MTFAFTAIGTVDEIRKQVAAADLAHSELGQRVQTLITDSLPTTEPSVGHTNYPYEYRFVVKAAGHSDAKSLSLNLTVEPAWVPAQRQAQEPTNGN